MEKGGVGRATFLGDNMKSDDLSKLRVNLRRRVLYHNKKYNTEYPVDNFSDLSKSDIKRVEKWLKREQKRVKFERKKNALLEAAIQAGLNLRGDTIRGEKSLDKARQRLKIFKSNAITKLELDAFMNRLQRYNTEMRFKRQGDNRLYFVPKNKKELIKFTKILDLAENKKFSEITKILKSGKKSFREFTRHNNNGQENFRDYIYKNNYLNSLRENGWGELADVIEKHGIQLIKELTDFGFHIDFFGYADDYCDGMDYEDYVLTGLENLADKVSPQFQADLKRYVKKHKY